MEFEAVKKYETSPLIGRINWQLPMNEFVQGNFSNAATIKEIYQQLLQKCFSESEKEYTKREDGSWNIYRKEKIEMLESKKAQLNEQYNVANNKVKKAINEKKEMLDIIRKKHEDNEKWKEFCTMISKALDTYPTIESVRDTAKEPWKGIISGIWSKIEDIVEKNRNINILEQKRSQIKQELDHKWNHTSIVAQLEDLHDWTEANYLREYIASKVKQVFSGDRFSREDIVDIERYYNEVLTTELCKHSLLDTTTCKKILRNHTDKIWVFEYFHSVYFKWTGIMRSIHEHPDVESATKVIIEKLHLYNKLLKEHYHWSTQISQEDIDFVEKTLLNKKEWPRYRITKDIQRLRTIFNFIAELDLDSYRWDFEDTVEAIWNADYYNYFQNTSKCFDLLVYLYSTMDAEEKKRIHEGYDSYNSFKKIRDITNQDKKEIEATQWILFAFTDDDNRNHRVRVLQEQIHTYMLMPDTLGDEEKKAIEAIVFAQSKTRLPLKYKETQYATIQNRQKSREHKQVVRITYLKELLNQELMWRKDFPRAVRTLQKHIVWNKESLYEQFPVLEHTAIEI